MKVVERPLLKSYVFVRIHEIQRTCVRLTEGVTNFLYNDSKPIVIKDKLIQHIRQFQQMYPQVEALTAETLLTAPGEKASKTTLRIDALNILLVSNLAKPLKTEASIDII